MSPWTAAGFKLKHAHHLSHEQSKTASKVANEVLERTGDEGRAVREGIAAGERVKGKKQTEGRSTEGEKQTEAKERLRAVR